MTVKQASWGVVATVKAPAKDILNFVAHHLEMGAQHIWIYLDAPNPEAKALLKAHPKVTPVSTGENYWLKARGKRPPMHQNRQAYNARHAYHRARNLDWLLHCDVDEFLWPDRSIAAQLAALPTDCLVARVRPAEALAPLEDGTEPRLYKRFIASKDDRTRLVAEIYPTFAPYLKGGFVSHVAGKIFMRTKQDDMTIKIHNVIQNGNRNPGQVELTDTTLLHMHTKGWTHWEKSFAYRHRKGSYRDELGAATPEEEGGLNLHKLFAHLAEEPDGLRQFYEEACLATPELVARLQAHDLLQDCALHLDATRQKHFPEF
ncbi:glycosyltransferase family 2 protein [Shimia sp. MMG029]|uniref:glycosyltransferase family 2 protein n=1 Tax=Shimia sp. MMG029 TaxID=3021978 RepID=UPI0022FDC752|nr:glycosyltransferase family 2 protein [Shimia sp. MMG029]MDA5557875.1 glycosyltransferase family 2 protein [Shimia sp. MMG029]